MREQTNEAEEQGEFFETERLRVDVFVLPGEALGQFDGLLFAARRRDIDQPEVIAHATYSVAMNYLDWLEVNTRWRRLGIATEFRRAIVRYLGREPHSCGASDDGVAFRQSLGLTD